MKLTWLLALGMAWATLSCNDSGSDDPVVASDKGADDEKDLDLGNDDDKNEGDQNPDQDDKDSQDDLLTSVAVLKHVANLAQANLEQFVAESQQLNTAIQEYCATPKPELKAVVQERWHQTNQSLQFLEAYKIGPLVAQKGEMRSAFYGFPNDVTFTCGVDDAVLRVTADDFPTKTRRIKGFGALEYLLFAPKEHSCGQRPSPAIRDADWDNLSQSEVDAKRCDYLGLVMGEYLTAVEAVKQAMTDFVASLQPWDQLNDAQAREQLQAFMEGLFYMDKVVKDVKLALPAGFDVRRCRSAGGCENTVEFGMTQASRESILYNLQGFRKLFASEQGKTFSAYLSERGGEMVGDQLLNNIDAAIANFTAQEQTLKTVAVENTDPGCAAGGTWICEAYASVKAITDDLKGDFLTILDLKLPTTAQGDND